MHKDYGITTDSKGHGQSWETTIVVSSSMGRDIVEPLSTDILLHKDYGITTDSKGHGHSWETTIVVSSSMGRDIVEPLSTDT